MRRWLHALLLSGLLPLLPREGVAQESTPTAPPPPASKAPTAAELAAMTNPSVDDFAAAVQREKDRARKPAASAPAAEPDFAIRNIDTPGVAEPPRRSRITIIRHAPPATPAAPPQERLARLKIGRLDPWGDQLPPKATKP